jgi:ATP-dependent Zn protease
VDQAANYALTNNRKIEARDLQRALDRNSGKDQPQMERVEWDDVVIAESVEQGLKSLLCLLEDPARTRSLGMDIPTGLLLIGPQEQGRRCSQA